MFKSAKFCIVVDSVEKALAFYTEKLLFSITSIKTKSDGGTHIIGADLRRGKCLLQIRQPMIDELAEFSMIRRCSGRAVGIVFEVAKNIEKFFSTCQKKKINVISNICSSNEGDKAFQARDPFGIKLIFMQKSTQKRFEGKKSFCGLDLNNRVISIKKDSDIPEDLVQHLKDMGISRRVAKKYVKFWAKNLGK